MPDSTALPLTLPSLTSDHRQQFLQEQPLLSLYEVFATIPEPRSKHGRRYELAYLLTCLVAALRGPCDSTLAVGEWCRDQRLLLIRLFGPRRAPRALPTRSIVNCCPVWMLSTSNGLWLIGSARRCVPNQRTPLPWTAKPYEERERTTSLLPHLLSFRTHHSQETLLQVVVSEKTNEIPIAQALLPCLPLPGRVCTADALQTQKDFFLRVDALGGAALLTGKKNQPILYADLLTYFADPHASFEQTSTRDEHRGRIEVRSIKVSQEMNGYLTDWPRVAEAGRTDPHGHGPADRKNQKGKWST